MQTKDYVDLNLAILLNKCGYNEPCEQMININTGYTYYCAYDHILMRNKQLEADFVSYPTLYEVQQWLRENHNIHIIVGNSASGYWWELSKADNGTTIYDYNYSGPNDCGKWDTYEKCLIDAILNTIKYKFKI